MDKTINLDLQVVTVARGLINNKTITEETRKNFEERERDYDRSLKMYFAF